MLATLGVKPAIVSNVRLRDCQSSMFGGDAKPLAVAGDFSQIVTSRSGFGYGSGRSSVASTSAKMALLAPMPSASVSVATSVNAGARDQLPERELDVVAQFFEEQGHAASLDLAFCPGPRIHA